MTKEPNHSDLSNLLTFHVIGKIKIDNFTYNFLADFSGVANSPVNYISWEKI